MPRLSPSFLSYASRHHPLLPLLLPECRTIGQASAELRWLREHAAKGNHNLTRLCERRSKGEPLQYIIGSQPFGELEVLCRRGVFIPRPETEYLTTHTANLITTTLATLPKGMPPLHPLRILDLCTGTGCIPLHLYSLLSSAGVPSQCLGVDISPAAIKLAEENMRHNTGLRALPAIVGEDVWFMEGNVLEVDALVRTVQATFEGEEGDCVDIVISNPPYISTQSFYRETQRSVRKYEPKVALVPPRSPSEADGDIFYPAVFKIAEKLGAKAAVVEVGGWLQAFRVKGYLDEEKECEWEGVRKWADYAGIGRAVVVWRSGWGWISHNPHAMRGGGKRWKYGRWGKSAVVCG